MTSLDVGARAPAFELPDQDGRPFKLADALAKGPVVVYFYPKDFTGGCTAEACSFRDLNPDFAAAGAQIVGISDDDVATHRKFADHHSLKFTLLADAGGKIAELYGVERALFGLAPGRVTFILDREGVVRHKFDSLFKAKKHVDEALTTVRRIAGASA